MDQTAFTMCRENNMPIIVFNMNKKGNLVRVATGEKCGTLVKNSNKKRIIIFFLNLFFSFG